ncbi:hypothetical protein EV126DRAFT_409818 [Verticillium dahliae]|nr:hypothetical protein EV126DRAFT_409818 [Verticillium dahliae]
MQTEHALTSLQPLTENGDIDGGERSLRNHPGSRAYDRAADVQPWGSFDFRIPCLRVLEIPAEMISLLMQGLDNMKTDLIPFNLAVSGMLTWARNLLDLKHEAESLAYDPSNGRLTVNYEVPTVSLAAFLAYYPHFFKLHKLHGIALFMHHFTTSIIYILTIHSFHLHISVPEVQGKNRKTTGPASPVCQQ